MNSICHEYIPPCVHTEIFICSGNVCINYFLRFVTLNGVVKDTDTDYLSHIMQCSYFI